MVAGRTMWDVSRGRRGRREAGFTVIEMVIVISLIALLAGMTLVNHRHGVTRAKEAVLKEDLFQMRDAIDQYYADKTKYPESLDVLITDGYLRRLPEDPFTKSATTWITIPAEADPNNPAAPAGIYDVKSGSDAKALDGTNYADW